MKFKQRLDTYHVHCPTCGMVPDGSIVRGARRESTIENRRASTLDRIVPTDRWESWATDLEIDRELEHDAR